MAHFLQVLHKGLQMLGPEQGLMFEETNTFYKCVSLLLHFFHCNAWVMSATSCILYHMTWHS